MARIRIVLDTDDGDYEVTVDSMGVYNKSDTENLDDLVAEAAKRIRRAYGSDGD